MKFYIVTPSYNQLNWLKRCVASVANQAGASEAPHVQVHHHVQDAQSKDGTADWLAEWAARTSLPAGYQLTFASEPDNGMYDAINRGWQRTPRDADVVAHMNCDEQYLPGGLRTIAAFMQQHPSADVVLADLVVIDAEGNYICHRRSLKPYAWISRYACAGFTATTFQRATVLRDKGTFFDTSWRNVGDKVWYNALHRAGCQFKVCNHVVALFADTGANMNWTEEGLREKQRYEQEFLNGNSTGSVLVSRLLGLRRLVKEWLLRPPTEYTYFWDNIDTQKTQPILHPTGLWHKKWKS